MTYVTIAVMFIAGYIQGSAVCPGRTCGFRNTKWGTIIGLITSSWISVAACTAHSEGQCKLIFTSYIFYLMTPFIIIMTVLLTKAKQSCCSSQMMFLLFTIPPLAGLIILIIGIIKYTSDLNDNQCFYLDWCNSFTYVVVVVSFICFIDYIYWFIKTGRWQGVKVASDEDDAIQEMQDQQTLLSVKVNKEKLKILKKIYDRWKQKKDIIVPLLDNDDSLWNIIWTMYWGMEKHFSLQTISETDESAKYSDTYTIYSWELDIRSKWPGGQPAQFAGVITRPYVIGKRIFKIEATTSSTDLRNMTVESVAREIGDIDFQTHDSGLLVRLATDFRKDMKTFGVPLIANLEELTEQPDFKQRGAAI